MLLRQVVLSGELVREGINVRVRIDLDHLLGVANDDLHVQALDVASCRAARLSSVLHLVLLLGGEAIADLQILCFFVMICCHSIAERRHVLLVCQSVILPLIHEIQLFLKAIAEGAAHLLSLL